MPCPNDYITILTSLSQPESSVCYSSLVHIIALE
jgi:hypothetical protein